MDRDDYMPPRTASSQRSNPYGGAQPPRNVLLRKRFLSIAAYARETQRYGSAGAPLSPEEMIRVYGSSIMPVPVPLSPGERAEEYEERFRESLQYKDISIESLYDDPHRERSLRISFALRMVNRYFTQRRKRVLDDDSNHPPPQLHIKYVDLETFKSDVRSWLFARAKNMSNAEKIQAFGFPVLPIHAPLARGESKEQYEERFREWLLVKQNIKLFQLHGDQGMKSQRYFRVLFESLNASGEETFYPKDNRKRERSPSSSHGRDEDEEEEGQYPPASKTKLFLDSQPPQEDWGAPAAFVIHRPASITCKEPGEEEKPTTSAIPSPSPPPPPLATPQDPGKCPSMSPLDGSLSNDAIIDAYMLCGCNKCLLQGMRQLASRVKELEQGCQCSKPPQQVNQQEETQHVVDDITLDDDTTATQSPKNQFSGSAAAAITRLVLSKPTPRDLYAQAHLTTSETLAPTEDSVEKQLLADYDAVNECIVVNEKVLEASATQLATTPITDIQETTRLQDENHELRQLIQDEMDKRNAALAMLIVYLWRHECEDLKRLVQDKTACNVLHVQRTSHHKCAKLSMAIADTRGRIETIKKALDAAMVATSSADDGDDSVRLQTLTELGEKLTAAEREMVALCNQRRREFVTLIHFDERVRVLVRTLLTQANS